MMLALTMGTKPAGAEPGAEGVAATSAAQAAYELRLAGKLDEAAALLDAAVAKTPGDAAVWFERARLNFQRADMEAAGEAIQKATALAPDRARYHAWAGTIAIYAGIGSHHQILTMVNMPFQFGDAKESLERAVELDPNNVEALSNLVAIEASNPWLLGGNRGDAKKHIDALEALDTAEGAAARCRLVHKDTEQRLLIWRRAVEKDDSARTRIGLGKEFQRQGDLEKAIEQYERARALDEGKRSAEWLDAVLSAGIGHAMLKQWDAAAEAYDVYLEHEPVAAMRAKTMGRLAKVCEETGDTMRAAELREAAKQLDPEPMRIQPVEDLFRAP